MTKEDWMDVPADEMTIQQARQAVKDLRKKLANMMIKPCTDTISREAVLDGIDAYINKARSTGAQGDFYSFAEFVKELASVTPAEKMGWWIDADGDNAICGCCNRLNHLYGDYCKHCGAKMEAKE